MEQSAVFSPLEKSPLQKEQVPQLGHDEPVSLSKYLPADTAYFYGFPTGEDSNFFNAVPTWIEELVAGRILTSAGPSIRAVQFAASMQPEVWHLLRDELGVSVIPQKNTIVFPSTINVELTGSARNQAIRSALKQLLKPQQLIMAQPYLGKDMESRYQIPPDVKNRLNDKINMSSYIPTDYLPTVERTYENGEEFARDVYVFTLPCVVKVSSSSSGDGVRICKTQEDLRNAKNDFETIRGRILIEEFIVAAYNICVQFGVPYHPRKPIDVIGYHRQLTSSSGEFLGGIVHPTRSVPSFDRISAILHRTILPRVREMGWYGVGGLDVLITDDGKFYFIDPNFRMNATTTYLFHVKNRKIRSSVLSFLGSYEGSWNEFRRTIASIATEGDPQQQISLVSLTKNGNTFRFHGGLLFHDEDERQTDLVNRARKLLRLGIVSRALQNVCE